MNKTYNYCSNCGKIGHTYNKCHTPITSMGIIVFRKSSVDSEQIEFLTIRRKDTLGYVDFLRGKYPLYNIPYLKNYGHSGINQLQRSTKHSIYC